MAMGSVELTDGRELPQFRLVFSKKGLFSSELIEPVLADLHIRSETGVIVSCSG